MTNRKSIPLLQMDQMDWRILSELQADARLSYSELGRRIGLSTPAAAERVRRLEDWGVIRGYAAVVDPERVGLAVGAFIRIRLAGPETLAQKLTGALAGMPEVLECHRCTGDESFILKVRVESVGQLETLIDKLTHFGATTTSLILSTPVERWKVDAFSPSAKP
jgi:Lrp/AsnC family leucine-responsive transcriptional regulator